MNVLNDGVAPAEDEVVEEEVVEETTEEETTEDEGGQHSEEDEGTSEDDDTTPDEENAEGEEGKPDPSDKDSRINGLMSNWQSEESAHNKTKTELDSYQKKFGPLDGTKPQIENEVENEDDLPESLKPGWTPKSTEDLQKGMRESAEYGAKKALNTIEQGNNAKVQAEESVNSFITEVKAVDPEFDEKSFYKYANEHNFPLKNVTDLRAVYSSHIALRRATGDAVKTAVKNKNKRVDSVNKPGSGGGGKGSGIDSSKIAQSDSASDLIHNHFEKK